MVWQGKTYGFNCVAFGPARVLLELTKEVAANEGKEFDEMIPIKLVRDSYVVRRDS